MPSGVISTFSRNQNLELEMRARFLQGKLNTCLACLFQKVAKQKRKFRKILTGKT